MKSSPPFARESRLKSCCSTWRCRAWTALRRLCDSIDEVLEQSEVIVVGNGAPEFADAMTRCRPDQTVIDLVRVAADFSKIQANYDGICW